jgi:ribulose-phosphate 3-epimerase
MISASVICANPTNLEADLRLLDKAAVDYLHIDIMDGVFVPRYGMYPEQVKAIAELTDIPMDVHMMVKDPEPYIEILAESGAALYSVQVGGNPHLHRTVQRIKGTGMKVGLAFNIHSNFDTLAYLLDEVDLILLMAINPGILGHSIWPGVFEKIREVKKIVDNHGKEILIQIDGGVTPESAPLMVEAGANLLVCGTGTIFRPHEAPVDVKVEEFRKLMASA